jgi:8-oxo-dGTP diphosphatase
MPPMQTYACGFLFSLDRTRVLLIRKRRPAWQAGRLNGVGGKIEPGETPAKRCAASSARRRTSTCATGRKC